VIRIGKQAHFTVGSDGHADPESRMAPDVWCWPIAWLGVDRSMLTEWNRN